MLHLPWPRFPLMWRRLPPANAASTHAPAGFTLVELLVVIGILAMLMALLTPVVFQARASSKNAAIKAEIDMLHMAIMNYKNEYGSFPPCVSAAGGAGAAAKHIQRAFPRTANVASQVTTGVTPSNSIVGWLSGYSMDPTAPVTGGTRRKLFDFDQTRMASSSYFPAGKPGAPYVYIDSANYLSSGAVQFFAETGGTYFGMRVPVSSSGNFTTVAQPAFNPDTFQILCAGADEVFGNDDDLSNFWKGTRKEYLDSL